jgi:hypothetical protein
MGRATKRKTFRLSPGFLNLARPDTHDLPGARVDSDFNLTARWSVKSVTSEFVIVTSFITDEEPVRDKGVRDPDQAVATVGSQFCKIGENEHIVHDL